MHTKHRQGALRRLGLNLPSTGSGRLVTISHLLAHAEGGVPTCIAALRLCPDPEAGAFLDKYDALAETDKSYLSIEEISLAAGVDPKRLLELCVSALVEDGINAGKIIAASFHPRVIRATAQCAELFPDNQADRRLFLQGTGFLPAPSNRPGGVFVNINNLPAIPETAGAEEVPDQGQGFNAAEDDLRSVHQLLDGNKLLEAPKTIVDSSSVQIGHQYRDQDQAQDVGLEYVPTPARK